jgi:hypothetical protein
MRQGSTAMGRPTWFAVGILLLGGCSIQEGKAVCRNGGDPDSGCGMSRSCPSGETDCGGTCVNLATAPNHCGSCGNACPIGHACMDGQCRPPGIPCPGNQILCHATTCVSHYTDPNNCGECDRYCGPGGTCREGECYGPADAGAPGCQPTWYTRCNGQCVNTSASNTNCGSCGYACGASQSCEMGRCACPSGQDACGSACVDLQTSSDNCGFCGNACPTGQSCISGACTVVCGGGQTNCSGTCRQTSSDPSNCGACGTVCPTGQTCSMGACACPAGLTRCDGRCVNTNTDHNNCGGCGLSCGIADCINRRCVCTDPMYSFLCPASTAVGFITCWDIAIDCNSILRCPDGRLFGCRPGYRPASCESNDCIPR